MGVARAFISGSRYNCSARNYYWSRNEFETGAAFIGASYGAFSNEISAKQMAALLVKYARENPDKWDWAIAKAGPQIVEYFDNLECKPE